MLDGVRKFVRERFERVTSKRPEDLARSVAHQGQTTKEQATRIAGDVAQWSKKNLGLVTEVVQREVRRQITRLGVATKEETNALRRRVRDLEGGADKTSAKKTVAKKTSARKAAARPAGGKSTKKVAAKKTAVRGSGAKKVTARKSARPAKGS